MTSFRKICLISLIVLFGGLGLATEVKADGVSLTLTPTTYQGDQFTLTGLFTNSGNLTFRANRFDLVSPPGSGQLAISAHIENGEINYTRPVPAMSSTPVLGLLDLSFVSLPPEGTYTFSLTFSGFDSSGVAFTTAPQQFTVDVPVPEPTTIALLSTGLLTAAASIRRRRSAEKN